MKKCLQCEQVYGDETNFCLSDGSTLVSVSGSYSSPGEAPTVFSGAPAPTGFNNPPFIPPVSTAAAQPAPAKSNTVLIALIVGLLALLIGGAVVGLAMYGIFYSGKSEPNAATNNSNSAAKSNQNASGVGQKNDNDTQNLKQQQEKLDKDKQKLEDERKALEAKKKESSPTPQTTPPPSARTAIIIDPPSNIRAAPNGAVVCVAQRRGTTVNILGSTGVSDNNGTWYYTDYCGRRGVIHSSQIRF